ncbi:MAG: response regulator [Anaerolineae bacterium]|nr:response regulator [Anaerolineae bacterium]
MKKILCVDDAPDMLKLLVRMLEMRGYEVAQARNGLEAIQKAESWQPHLIITDIVMPYMDGLDAITALRNNPQTANIPIVVFTASLDDEERQKALELGADDHMPKPFDSVILDTLLQRYLGPNASIQNFEQTRQDEIKEAAAKVLLAQKMNLAYKLELYKANPDLVATMEYYTALTRDIVHGLRNRLGILQSYMPQAKYCTQLLEGLALLHLKPSLAQEFSDGTAIEITFEQLMSLNADKYKIHTAGYGRDKLMGITLKGWLDSDLLSLGLWLFFQGLSGCIPDTVTEDMDTSKRQVIQIHDNRLDNDRLGMDLYLVLPTYPRKKLIALTDLRSLLQGNVAAVCLMLLNKTVFLNGGTLRINQEGEIYIKVPATSNNETLEEMETAISHITAQLPQDRTPYELCKPLFHSLTHGFIAAMDQELQKIMVEVRQDAYFIANEKFLSIVLRNCTYARLLLENLRWLGTGYDLPQERVDVAEAVEAIREVLRGRIRDRLEDEEEGLMTVHQNIPAHLPAIKANWIAVQQILLNCIVNALEAMPQKGILILRACLEKSEVCIEIGDTGQGILPENIPAIFDIAFTTKRGKRYGTGLYIVNTLVERLDGRIEVESVSGSGSIVRLYFPAAKQHQ